jgi:hypothetical protein
MTRMSASAQDRQLERQGIRLGRPAIGFIAFASLLAVPGLVLVLVGSSWVLSFGIVLLALAIVPAVIGGALLLSSFVSRWAARRKLFA